MQSERHAFHGGECRGHAFTVRYLLQARWHRRHEVGPNSGMMKMIFSTGSRRLLGVHILGEGATEPIHIGQAVLNLKGTIG